MKRLYLSSVLALAAACNPVEPPSDPVQADAATPPPVDAAPPTPVDAGADAPTPPVATSNAPVLVAGGGVARGPTFTLTVQIGEALVPRPVAGPTTTLAPRGAIQP